MCRLAIAGMFVVGWGIGPGGIAAAEESPASQRVVQASAKTGTKKTPIFLLRYRFKTGEKLRYTVTHNSDITATDGGAKDVATFTSTTRKHLNVKSVNSNGHAVLESVIDYVKMSKQHNDGKKYKYESTDKAKPAPQFTAVARTIGVPLVRLEVDTLGKLIKATPLLRKDVLKKVAKSNGPKRASDDASKNFLVVFPKKPLPVGSTWTDKDFTVNLRVTQRLWRKFVILRTYKLESVAKGIATIKLTMAPIKAIREPNLRVQIVQQMLSGTIEFDIVRGVIVSRRLTANNKVYGFAQGKGVLHAKTERVEQIIRQSANAGGSTTKKN